VDTAYISGWDIFEGPIILVSPKLSKSSKFKMFIIGKLDPSKIKKFLSS
jgi:hypothetical protein